MRITKKMEAKDDLKRYQKMLENTQDIEDREFLISGIVNIDTKYRNNLIWRNLRIWDLMERINESFYSHQAIANFCAVGLEDIKRFVSGKMTDEKTIKKIAVGLDTYGI